MIAWGVAMPLVGSPIENQDGWALALQLGLFSGVFESIQVMRNADETLWTRVLGVGHGSGARCVCGRCHAAGRARDASERPSGRATDGTTVTRKPF
jgi:hypothetical protein